MRRRTRGEIVDGEVVVVPAQVVEVPVNTKIRVIVDGPLLMVTPTTIYVSGWAEMHRIPKEWVEYAAPVEVAVMEGYV